MMSLDENEIKDFICNETTSFALSMIDLVTFEVLYSNNAMKDMMSESWSNMKEFLNIPQKEGETNYGMFENESFNEIANRWYKVHNKVVKLSNGQDVILSIAIDISEQKEAQGKLISTQVNLVKQAQELEEAHEKLKEQANRDPLTDLYNRRYFLKTAEHLLDLAKRNKTNMSVLMLDIDCFKEINDQYGHKIGDNVIILLSQIMLELTRKSDIICRWGGEEFVVLLPETDTDGALKISQKIRLEVEASVNFVDTREFKFTVSIGLSEVSKKDMNIEASINRADIELYKAKDSGRNMVCHI